MLTAEHSPNDCSQACFAPQNRIKVCNLTPLRARFWEILSQPLRENGQFRGYTCTPKVQFPGICLAKSQPFKQPFGEQMTPLKRTSDAANVPLKQTFRLI
jgi:hypothetical protein